MAAITSLVSATVAAQRAQPDRCAAKNDSSSGSSACRAQPTASSSKGSWSAVIAPASGAVAPPRAPPDSSVTASPSSCFSRRMPDEHPCLHGAERGAGQCGDLPLGVAAVVGERQRLPLRGRQPAQGGADLLGDQPGHHVVLHVARGDRLVQDQLLLRQRLTAALGLLTADGVDRLVVHDREQPGGDAALAALVGRRIPPDAEENFLQNVLGQDVVGEDPPGERESRPAEAFVEVIDGVRVARADAAEDGGVPLGVLRTPYRGAHSSHGHTHPSQTVATAVHPSPDRA